MESIRSSNVEYHGDCMTVIYNYDTVNVKVNESINGIVAEPMTQKYRIRTCTKVPTIGLLLVGIGGNNGTTVTAGIIANKNEVKWETKDGWQNPNWYGSFVLNSTMKIGDDSSGNEIYFPIYKALPFSNPHKWAIGGWDINSESLGDAMQRAQVLDVNLQKQIYSEMQKIKPMKGIYIEGFIASNQSNRVDNVMDSNVSREQMVETIRADIRKFKCDNCLDKVIVVWTASTEKCVAIVEGVNDTAVNFVEAVRRNAVEIAPSSLYCMASIFEDCSFINGSPQNTFVPGIVELARKHNVLLSGDDFKSGQTKLKTVLVDFLVSSGMKPLSIVSYNHLGNNDGKNLSEELQFRSKELSKSSCVDAIVATSNILYKVEPTPTPDQVVVIKYVPAVGDSKRAMDEYYSEIFMGGKSSIAIYNVCEDSLLASPMIIDLVLLTELFERITFTTEKNLDTEEDISIDLQWDTFLSVLSYFYKSSVSKINQKQGLHDQRACILNFLRACLGLPPENFLLLEKRLN